MAPRVRSSSRTMPSGKSRARSSATSAACRWSPLPPAALAQPRLARRNGEAARRRPKSMLFGRRICRWPDDRHHRGGRRLADQRDRMRHYVEAARMAADWPRHGTASRSDRRRCGSTRPAPLPRRCFGPDTSASCTHRLHRYDHPLMLTQSIIKKEFRLRPGAAFD